MNHADHVNLLRGGVPDADATVGGNPGGVWADFGSGSGAFTLALAELIGPRGKIYSVDKDQRALREQEWVMRARFPAVHVHYLVADFTHPLKLPLLDGAVMANALHFLRHKEGVVRLIHGYLKPGGRLRLVEYNADRGNLAAPYPLTYAMWEALADKSGFTETHLLARRPSRFLHEIYAAESRRGEEPTIGNNSEGDDHGRVYAS